MVKYYIYIQYISNIIRYYSIYFSIFYPYVIHIFHIFSHLFPSFFKDYNAFLRHETLRVAVLQLFDEAEERLAEAEAAAAAEARQRKHPKSAGGFHGKRMKKVDFAWKYNGKSWKKIDVAWKNLGKMMEVTYDLRMRKWCSERIVIFDGFKMIQPEMLDEGQV